LGRRTLLGLLLKSGPGQQRIGVQTHNEGGLMPVKNPLIAHAQPGTPAIVAIIGLQP